MTEVLTDLTLRKLAPKAKGRAEIWDAKVPGFGVRVSPTGSKSFVLVYRFKGHSRRFTLGRYPVMGLSEARELALDTLRNAKRGIDPQAAKAETRTTVRFDKTVDLYIKTYSLEHNRDSTRREKERLLKSRFVRLWAAHDIQQIGTADVVDVIDRALSDGPSAANHALAEIRHFFNWCVDRGLLDSSPCARITRPAKKGSRDRVLSDAEIVGIWSASGATGYPFGSIVQLLILTGQRRGEVTNMQWSEINFDDALWTIPGDRTKNGQVHVVPLAPKVVALLKQLPHIDQHLIFPARGRHETSFSGFSRAKRRLEIRIASGIDRHDDQGQWGLHDIRRTVATRLAGLGIQPHVIERLLNHVSGTLGGIAGVYNRFKYLDEVRSALELWSSYVDRLSEPATDEAVAGMAEKVMD